MWFRSLSMNLQEPLMFHKAYPLDSFLEEAKRMEKEKELMISYLPKEYREMQRRVEETCDRMEYEGSCMYDEHPDGKVIRHLVKKIQKQLAEGQKDMHNEGKYQEDIISCFLYNEIFRRRYRMWRSKQYIK